MTINSMYRCGIRSITVIILTKYFADLDKLTCTMILTTVGEVNASLLLLELPWMLKSFF